MLVVRVAGAPARPRRGLRRRRPRAATRAGTLTAPVTTVTAIRAEPLGTLERADSWLEAVGSSDEAIGAEIAAGEKLANAAVHGHRAASLDPRLADVSAEHALAVRIGWGEGERLADGRWQRAIEIPRESRRRPDALRPQEAIAALLAGREAVPPFVALILRARADLDAGRDAEAVLELRSGVDALLIELGASNEDGAALPAAGEAEQAADLDALAERRAPLATAAIEALHGRVESEHAALLAETLEICERVLRRRRAHAS